MPSYRRTCSRGAARFHQLVAVSLAVLALSVSACSSSGSADTGRKRDSGAKISYSSGSVQLHRELPHSIQQSGRVIVLSDIPSPPFEMFESADSQQVTGLDYDVAQALGAQLGVQFRFKQTPFAGIIPALQAGQGDVIISEMSVKPEREKVLDFVEYFYDGTGILVPKGNPKAIKTLDDLCGKSVATQSGTIQVDFLQSQSKACTAAGKPSIDVAALPTIPNAELALNSNKVVAVVEDTASMAYAARTVNGGNSYELVTAPGKPAGYQAAPGGIGVLKKDKQLTAAIQKALQAIIADGTYAKILAKYGLQTIAVNKAVVASSS